MRFSVLSSGSKANTTYLESGSTRILIDCGLSARTVEQRLSLIGVDPSTIEGIIITHEHSDHIRGVERFSRLHEIPVYANNAARKFVKGAYAVERFETGKAFSIGDLEISPVSIVHDSGDPVGFVIVSAGIRFGHFTDLGKVTPLVKEAVTGCHSLVLESNHDPDMLWGCSYPWDLKQRISSSHGHLSNAAAGELLSEMRHDGLHQVVLGHISENSNTHEMALNCARHSLEGADCGLYCGSVYQPLPLLAASA
jgi:phosphoribosyl 1,2-cyclic phosphodiesterase